MLLVPVIVLYLVFFSLLHILWLCCFSIHCEYFSVCGIHYYDCTQCFSVYCECFQSVVTTQFFQSVASFCDCTWCFSSHCDVFSICCNCAPGFVGQLWQYSVSCWSVVTVLSVLLVCCDCTPCFVNLLWQHILGVSSVFCETATVPFCQSPVTVRSVLSTCYDVLFLSVPSLMLC